MQLDQTIELAFETGESTPATQRWNAAPSVGYRSKRTKSRVTSFDERDVEIILAKPMEYMDNEAFHQPNAEQTLFHDPSDLPTPNTSWYLNAIDRMTNEDQLRESTNVVLNTEQEQLMFLRFNYARLCVVRLQEKAATKKLTAKDKQSLVAWFCMAKAIREQIAQFNLALVLAMTKRIKNDDVDFTELVSEGNLVLLRAIDKFSVSRNYKFSTYACCAILNAFGRMGKRVTRYRRFFPTEFDPTLERSDFDEVNQQQQEEDCAAEVRCIVDSNRAELTEVEQAVIQHRFPIGQPDTAASMTLQEVGRELGLSKERVRQIQNKALNKIRRSLERNYLDGTNRSRLNKDSDTSPSQ